MLVEEHTPDGLRLNTPAGHLELGESPAEACAREALEETGHRFTPTALVGVYLARARPGSELVYLRFAFAGLLGEREAGRSLDEGIVRTLWMTPDEIRASADRHRTPLLLRGVEDHVAGQRYPLELIHADPSVFGA